MKIKNVRKNASISIPVPEIRTGRVTMMAENNGWIKLHRKLLDNPIIMKDSDHLAVWTYLLLNATHAEYPALFKGQKIILKPGQLITGRKSIAEKLSINESKVRRILDSFENDQQIDRQRSNQNSLISLNNWELYQIFDQQIDQQMTNNRPTDDQQPTTNKKNKNVKNEKNVTNTYSDIPELNEAILEFVKFRKGIKKPMTDNAIKLLIGKLNKMTSIASEQIDIINQSILAGWTDVYPLKKQSGRKEVVPDWMNKPKKSSFHNYQQRDYDFDELEKELLGESDPNFIAEREALQKELEEKYGKGDAK